MGFDDRRAEVVQAAWRVIAREGLDRTSMRAIAQELSSSTGVVTHYFRNKEELTLFALEQVFESVVVEMRACAQKWQGLERLEQMLFLALPLAMSYRDDWKVWVAFLGYSIGRDRLIQEHCKRYGILREILVETLAELQAEKLIRAELDLIFEANALIALVDGISLNVVINPEQFSASQQQLLVQRHVQQLRGA